MGEIAGVRDSVCLHSACFVGWWYFRIINFCLWYLQALLTQAVGLVTVMVSTRYHDLAVLFGHVSLTQFGTASATLLPKEALGRDPPPTHSYHVYSQQLFTCIIVVTLQPSLPVPTWKCFLRGSVCLSCLTIQVLIINSVVCLANNTNPAVHIFWSACLSVPKTLPYDWFEKALFLSCNWLLSMLSSNITYWKYFEVSFFWLRKFSYGWF